MENVSSRCGKSDNAPRLRFPEFRGEWVEKKLGEIFKKNTEKNTELKITNVICNSAKNGLIPQREYFDKDIANSENINGYYIIQKYDFVYNPRKSTEAPYGPVSVYKYPEKGIVSPLYLCFRATEEINSDFYEFYFKSSSWHRYIYLSGDNGARHDRVSMRDDVFFAMPVNIPFLPEQKKIAAFFTLLDRRIQKQRQLVEFLKTYKRGYFRYLLSTFTTKEYLLNDIIFEYTEKATSNRQYPILSSTMNGIKLQTTYFNKYAASENTIGYKIVPYGYFTYRSMSDTGEFHFNYQDIIDKGIVSPAYPVFCVSEFHNSRFVEYILNETDFIKSQLMIAKEGGTRYALSFPKFQRLRIQLPDKFIQDKVAKQIVLFERKISSEEKVLLSFEVQKKHLLQQMFI